MVDPVSALATATAAFKLIKKGFSVGKDIESMYGRSLTMHMGRMHGMNFCKCKEKSESKEKK